MQQQLTGPDLADATVLTDRMRSQLRDDGYFITDVLFDDATLAAVRGEFRRIWDDNVAACLSAPGLDALTIEQARFRPFLAQLDQKSQVCRDFIRHRHFQALARQLVGPDIDLSWNQAVIKPPVGSAAIDNSFAWHQDPWYALNGDYAKDSDLQMLKDPHTSITCWVAISRTTVENGTLWVLPGRHQDLLCPHVWSETRREWQGQFDTTGKVPAILQSGQMLVMNKYLPHGSGPNISDECRMAYQISYSVAGIKLVPSIDVSPLLRGGVEV